MEIKKDTINLIALLLVFITLGFSYWSRVDLMPFLTLVNYIIIFALATIIIILPDFISSLIKKENWYSNIAFFSISVLLFLAFIGFFVDGSNLLIQNLIYVISSSLLLWYLMKNLRRKAIPIFMGGLFFSVFIVLLFFLQGFHHPLYVELLIIGEAHIDVLFHSSISNLIDSIGYATTGIDGTPYIKYHWGSHLIFAGLSKLAGINSLMFYNIAYPAIFIALFFKSFILFVIKLGKIKSNKTVGVLYIITILSVFYSLKIFGFMGAHPMNSESLCLSLIFAFLYGTVLLNYSKEIKNIISFNIFSFAILSIILFLKISTGFVIISGVFYLVLRSSFSVFNILKISISGILIFLFGYFLIFLDARGTVDSTIARRLINFWTISNGAITIFSGIIIYVLVLLKNHYLLKLGDFSELVKSKKYIDIEMVAVICLAGIIGGIAVSANPSDVFYFIVPQFFLAVAYLIFYSHEIFSEFKASKKIKQFFLLLIILISLVSSPKVLFIAYNVNGIKENVTDLTPEEEVLKQYIVELYKLKAKLDKVCIYIPQTEHWYYKSQKAGEVASALITPAISGIPLIGGIPKSILDSDNTRSNYYGVYFYKKKVNKYINSLEEAKKQAKEKGYSELIFFKEDDSRLSKHVFRLDY